MKSSSTFVLGALLSLVAAQPMMDKRDSNTVTVTDVVVVTVDVYTTVDGTPPAASSASNTKLAQHLAYHAQSQAEVQAQPTPSSSAAQQQPPAAQSSSPPLQQKVAAQPAAGSTPEEIQAAEDAKQAAINQQQINTNNAQKQADFAHQSQAISQQNAGGAPASQPPAQPAAPSPPPVQQAPPSSAPAAPAQSPAPAPPSGGGSCGSIGGSCSGDVTIYNDQGLGACGWSNDTNSEDFFALAAPLFGTYTNDAPGPHKNPFCGRMASIQVNGKSFTGMLTDRCGGCVGDSIDLSQHLFSQLYPNEPPGNGRYHNVPWEFTSGPIYSQG